MMPKKTGRYGKTLQQGTAGEVFRVFLKLGLTSFGGPIAHLGYFREEIVVRRGWLSEAAYAELMALCQFLPGPASSQLGFALGMRRAGWGGALAAFIAFTMPSAVLLMLFALGAASISGPVGTGALHGLKIVAVAIVAQAVLGMARSLCPDRERTGIAALAVILLAFLPTELAMIASIMIGAGIGISLGRADHRPAASDAVAMPVTKAQGRAALIGFIALLLGLPILARYSMPIDVINSFYRAGSFVFGGGHVVLPLLEAGVVSPGWIAQDEFLAGYGAAQAVPGPLFTFASYLGMLLVPAPNGIAGAVVVLCALFLPGFLLLIAALPYWEQLRGLPKARSAMQGANAAVVGVLGAALYSPVFTSAVYDMRDFALATVCFVALVMWKVRPWVVVLVAAVGGAGLGLLG